MKDGVDFPAKGVAYNMITEEKQQQDQLLSAKSFDTKFGTIETFIAPSPLVALYLYTNAAMGRGPF